MEEYKNSREKTEPQWRYILRLILNIMIPASGWFFLCFLGPKLLGFFMPFVVGWIIAMIANPLVRFLERRLKLVRRHSSIVIVAGALALVIGILYLAVSRMLHFIWSFIQDLPVLYAGIEGDVQSSLGRLEGIFDFMPETMRDAWMTLGDNLGAYIGKLAESIASPTMEAAGTVAKGIPAALVYFVVIILSAYFFIADRDRILSVIRSHMPEWTGRYSNHLKKESRRLIGGYFMAQFKIMAVVWLILTAGFFILGVSYGPLWALLIALLDFLPVFGTGTALIPWGIIKVLGGEYAFAAGLILIYVLTQVIRQLVQPKLVGDTMGLNPLLTLFLLYLGFKIRGLAGMILAVPIGLFIASLYRFGAFKGMTDSARELAEEISRFRGK